ncbi:MAG: hypothetical protein V4649_07075 [Bacteroidota bacterium]
MEPGTLVLLEAIRILQIKFKALETVMETTDTAQFRKYEQAFNYLYDVDAELREIKKQLEGV